MPTVPCECQPYYCEHTPVLPAHIGSPAGALLLQALFPDSLYHEELLSCLLSAWIIMQLVQSRFHCLYLICKSFHFKWSLSCQGEEIMSYIFPFNSNWYHGVMTAIDHVHVICQVCFYLPMWYYSHFPDKENNTYQRNATSSTFSIQTQTVNLSSSTFIGGHICTQ